MINTDGSLTVADSNLLFESKQIFRDILGKSFVFHHETVCCGTQ